MSFTKKVKLYFDQADPGGVAFHGQHSNMAQRVFEDYLPTLGISWEEWFSNKELFFPVVQLNIKYTKPLFPGKEYLIQMDFTYMGKSSLHASYKIFNPERDLCCSLFVVYVCVNKTRFQSQAFPEKLATLLRPAIKPVKATSPNSTKNL